MLNTCYKSLFYEYQSVACHFYVPFTLFMTSTVCFLLESSSLRVFLLDVALSLVSKINGLQVGNFKRIKLQDGLKTSFWKMDLYDELDLSLKTCFVAEKRVFFGTRKWTSEQMNQVSCSSFKMLWSHSQMAFQLKVYY